MESNTDIPIVNEDIEISTSDANTAAAAAGIVFGSKPDANLAVQITENEITEVSDEDIRKSKTYRQLQQRYDVLKNDYDAVEDSHTDLEMQFRRKEEELKAAITRAENAESGNIKLNAKIKSLTKELEKARQDISEGRATFKAISDLAGKRTVQVSTGSNARSKKLKTAKTSGGKVSKNKDAVDVPVDDPNFDRNCRCGKQFGATLNMRRHFFGSKGGNGHCWSLYTSAEISRLFDGHNDLEKAISVWESYNHEESAE